MMESRIGNLKSPVSRFGRRTGSQGPGISWSGPPAAPPCKHCHSRRPLRARRALNTEATGLGGRILMAALCS
jgi:hypothetical protein